jgi:hypothetical protein
MVKWTSKRRSFWKENSVQDDAGGVEVSLYAQVGAAADRSRRREPWKNPKSWKSIGFIGSKRCGYLERGCRVGGDCGSGSGPKRRSKMHPKLIWRGSGGSAEVDGLYGPSEIYFGTEIGVQMGPRSRG